MDIQKVRLIPRDLEAVQFTKDNEEAVRQWVQDNSPFESVVAQGGRLYLPIDGGQGLDIVVLGEFVLRDPVGGDFTSCTEEVYYAYYEEVSS
jgi:hypothetical protein